MKAKRYRVSFWDDEYVLKVTVMMVAHIWEYTENHRIVHFKWVNYTVCECYFSKAVKQNHLPRPVSGNGRQREINCSYLHGFTVQKKCKLMNLSPTPKKAISGEGPRGSVCKFSSDSATPPHPPDLGNLIEKYRDKGFKRE